MKPQVNVRLIGLFFLISASLIFIDGRFTRTRASQEPEKKLDIERYPSEPLQLVGLRIGTQSVQDQIKLKFRDNRSKWGIDTVTFNDADDWYKHVSVTFRNASEKPVYGVQAYLFFKQAGSPPTIFSVSMARPRELSHNPLHPGEEIELSVNQDLLNSQLGEMKNRGADVSQAQVSFSLDTVFFSDELQWYRGKLLKPDPVTPNKWIPVNGPAQR